MFVAWMVQLHAQFKSSGPFLNFHLIYTRHSSVAKEDRKNCQYSSISLTVSLNIMILVFQLIRNSQPFIESVNCSQCLCLCLRLSLVLSLSAEIKSQLTESLTQYVALPLQWQGHVLRCPIPLKKTHDL